MPAVSDILNQMKQNAQAWHNVSSQAEKNRLAQQNMQLGSQMGWTRDSSGVWRDSRGNDVFKTYNPSPYVGSFTPATAVSDAKTNYPNFTPVTGVSDVGYAPEPSSYYSEPDQSSMYQQMFDAFQKIMQQMTDQNSQYMKQLQEEARRQAEAIAKQKQQALESTISNLKNSQESALMGINNSVEDAKMALDDKAFQQWLAARQAMANRGLAGSGLASDQDTRLLLQKQRDLSGIYRDAARNMFDVNSRYGNQLDDAYKQLQGINTDEIYSGIYSDLYKNANSDLSNQAKLYLDMLSKVIGYELPTADTLLGTQFKYDQLSSNERQFYDKLATEDKQFYAKLDSEERRFYANLDNENRQLAAKLKQDYNLKLYEIMGVGPNGQPTLDAMKLAETIRSNRNSEALSASRLSVDAQRLATDIDQFNQKMQLEADKLMNSQWRQQGAMLNQVIQAKGNTIKQIQSMIESTPDETNRSALKQQLANEIKDYQASIEALARLSQATTGNTSQANSLISNVVNWVRGLFK